MNKAWATPACLFCLLPSFALARPVNNKELVKTAITSLFIKRDPSAVSQYWAKNYIQHNPNFPSGSGVLENLAKSMSATFKYEMGMVIADGDLVMIHGRYSGIGPRPSIIVDIFRVRNGKICEHWDVGQEEVPASKTKSGNSMFSPDEQK